METAPVRDARGAFARLFCENELSEIIKGRHIVQINQSWTRIPGTVRGLHYQRPPYAEMKLIRCLKGRAWDVAVDLRKGSRTLLQYFTHVLEPDSLIMVAIPEGFAHGFQVLESDTELLYLHTTPFVPDSAGIIRFDDPKVDIAWPLPVVEVSDRDKGAPLLDAVFEGFEI